MEISGKISLELFGKGSKSEHNAVFIQTETNKFRLRKKGGNSFYDKELHDSVDKTVTLKGEPLNDDLFIVESITRKQSGGYTTTVYINRIK